VNDRGLERSLIPDPFEDDSFMECNYCLICQGGEVGVSTVDGIS
jgi:hypothetical protein